MKAAFIQSVGGASGDMLLGALLDAGLSPDAIRETIDALGIDGIDIDTSAETRCEVRGTRVLVDVSAAPRYSPAQMLDTVADAGGLSERTRERATAVLKALFAAEARVHGGEPDQIHLHELGTADTLVDVVGVVHGLEQLGVGRVYASPLVLGEPTGPRRPGGYSNPAPATLEIIAAAGAPVAPERQFHAGVGELTTPTGAALITTLADEFRQPSMTIDRIGVGAGGKDPAAFPNVLRLWLGEIVPSRHSRESGNPQSDDDAAQPFARWQDNVVLLETNLDNATGEQLGFAMERLFEAGAFDVWHTPIQMKKNRPGVLLSALGPAHLESRLAEVFLRDTPTLGVRVRPVGRYVADRDIVMVETEYGPMRLKRKWLAGEVVSAAPEYEDVAAAAAAQTNSISWQTVAESILKTPSAGETFPSHRRG
ncbi:MAG: nickel pincer cofactor biosynthesis protein LarC [Chloroflexota bacterium]|nr:nickel pincer cofactor biosynthesis protein LarC [Chloroflexota bacterium]MDE2959969.1 nickel pincer cofactor biosynthesis protein LarC [Chloroflexota bacterium]